MSQSFGGVGERGGSEHAPGLPGAASAHTARLLKITSAIANAVSSLEVYEALVDHVAEAIDASSAALWLLDDARQVARLAHARGYAEAARQKLAVLPLDMTPRTPALDAIRRSEAIWIPSQAALLEQYPHLQPMVSPGRSYRIYCLPLITHGRVVGSLAFTAEQPGEIQQEERGFLLVVAGYASQAIERLRLLESERRSHDRANRLYQDALDARARAERLYAFAQAAVTADQIDSVFTAAADAIEAVLSTARSAILTFDEKGPMRFRAWRNLSEGYRQAVEGHSPWSRDALMPEAVLVPDVENHPDMAPLLPLLRSEGIAALAFIPLVSSGRLIGKFMVYYEHTHAFPRHEIETACAIANHLASVINRFTAVAQLQDTVRYNELFTGVLAHDLRNPLGAMMMAAERVLKYGEDEKARKPLRRIIASGERMTRMIDQLLDFTRARLGGAMQLQRQRLDLRQLAKQTMDEVELTAPGWSFALETAGDLEGEWDADRMAQVFSNLAGNAVQHGSSEQPVVLRLDGRKQHLVDIEVNNRGVIEERILPRLFEPFRITQHKSDGRQGLGLGLYITQQVVRAHGGEISVTSGPSEGTTFRIRVPRGTSGASSSPDAVRTREAAPAPAPARSERPLRDASLGRQASGVGPVLLVDDDRDIREALADLLVDRGFSVITARNGAEALTLLRSLGTPPSIILLDIMMPVMDGYGFLEARARDAALSRIPVAVITAGHGVDRARLGAHIQVLSKPINLPKLMRTLQEFRAPGELP